MLPGVVECREKGGILRGRPLPGTRGLPGEKSPCHGECSELLGKGTLAVGIRGFVEQDTRRKKEASLKRPNDLRGMLFGRKAFLEAWRSWTTAIRKGDNRRGLPGKTFLEGTADPQKNRPCPQADYVRWNRVRCEGNLQGKTKKLNHPRGRKVAAWGKKRL